MSMRWSRANGIAVLGVVAAATILAHAVAGIDHERGPTPAVGVLPQLERPVSLPAAKPELESPEPAALHRQVLKVIAANPFRPDRRRGTERYRPPGTPLADTAAPTSTAQPVRFRIVGIASQQNGDGLVAVQIERGPAKLLRVGNEIDGYTLVQIDRSQAHFAGRDTTFVLKLSSPAGTNGTT